MSAKTIEENNSLKVLRKKSPRGRKKIVNYETGTAK